MAPINKVQKTNVKQVASVTKKRKSSRKAAAKVVKKNVASQVPQVPDEFGKLAERAMLVDLSTSLWTARKHDKEISDDVADRNGASKDLGRYNKQLIAKERFKKLNSIASQLRVAHLERTLPWNDAGARILPADLFFDYTTALDKLKDEFNAAADEFAEHYPDYVAERKLHSGTLIKDDEFPPADQIRGKFNVRVQILPFPSASDFRVTLAEDDRQMVKDQITSQMRETMEHAMQDCWQRAYSAVKHMAERLEAYTVAEDGGKVSNPFRDSMVGNMRELVDLLPRLNVMKDPNLDAMTREIKQKLTAHSADSLRSDPAARKTTADSAKDILNKMSAYLGAY